MSLSKCISEIGFQSPCMQALLHSLVGYLLLLRHLPFIGYSCIALCPSITQRI